MDQAKLRIDKWLWQARFFKTRSLAAKQVSGGHVRLNGNRVLKPAQAIGPGDVLTFPQGRIVRVVRVEALGERRGPATEAQTGRHDANRLASTFAAGCKTKRRLTPVRHASPSQRVCHERQNRRRMELWLQRTTW